jgi:hypothetical protein
MDSDADRELMRQIKNQIMMTKMDDAGESEISPAIRHAYRNLFLNSDEGRKVLAHLLTQMGYNRKISHPQEIGIHNVAQGILNILGVGSQSMLEESLASWAILPPED